MQIAKREGSVSKTLKDSAVSIPNSIYASKVLNKDIDVDINKGFCPDSFCENSFAAMWNQQHPLIHTWLVLSSASICFLSALFFIIP